MTLINVITFGKPEKSRAKSMLEVRLPALACSPRMLRSAKHLKNPIQ
jgi:hypothetical protein